MFFLRSLPLSAPARGALLFFASLCGLAALPAQAKDMFAITRDAHESYSDSVCASEFGQDYRAADWRDIEAQYHETGSLDAFFSQTGLKPGGVAQVLVNGEPRLPADTRRVFFIERHDGKKPDYFLAHAEINRHQLSLGSWMGARSVLCVASTRPPVRSGQATQEAQAGNTAGQARESSAPGGDSTSGLSGDSTSGLSADSSFGLTRQRYPANAVSSEVCAGEFAGGARLADWRDIERYYREKKTFYDFLRPLGWQERENAYVTLDGKGSGVYHATRHNGNKPEGYDARATIFGHMLDLGAEEAGTRRIAEKALCVSSSGKALTRLAQPEGAASSAQDKDFPFRSSRNALASGLLEEHARTFCEGGNGKAWRPADWRDIEAYYRKTGSLDEFFQRVEFSTTESQWPGSGGVSVKLLYITVNGKPFETTNAGPAPRSRHDTQKTMKEFYVLMVRAPGTPLFTPWYDKAKNTPLAGYFSVVRDNRKLRILCTNGR